LILLSHYIYMFISGLCLDPKAADPKALDYPYRSRKTF
jgi:hypothetical protein